MTAAPTPIGDGKWAVPGNRWDLVTDTPDRPVVSDPPEISVVVPYFENQRDLDLVLTALGLQTHPASRLQVVIADDGSLEPPRTDRADGRFEVELVRQENRGFRAGAARNLGFRRSEGSVILFLDGDTVPEPDYVAQLGRLPGLLPDAVVSGRRRYADLSGCAPEDLTTWLTTGREAPREWPELDWLTNEYGRSGNLLTVGPRSYKYLIGAVLGCSRDMVQELDGFDESIIGYGGEDYDFTYRAYNAGAVLAHVPAAVAWHDGPDWAGRTDPADQMAQKNREIMMLAERIPEPSMRGSGQIYSVPDAAVAVHVAGWSLGSGVLCVRSLLAALDCHIRVVGTDETSGQLRAAFAQDPRVTESPLDDPRFRRERWWIDVYAPVDVTDAFSEHLAAQTDHDLGLLSVTDGGELVLEAESARHRWRDRRHRSATGRARVSWFVERNVDLVDCGLSRLDPEPALAATFGGY